MRKIWLLVPVFALLCWWATTPSGEAAPTPTPPGWLKGNTHTHTLWSDGDEPPELVTAWDRDHGYNFLVLSDHNVIANSEEWVPVSRVKEKKVKQLQSTFGTDAVSLRKDGQEMRLVTLSELRQRFEKPGQFLMMTGEEITDSYNKYPVHVNGLNLAEIIPPQHGKSVTDVANRNLRAVVEQGRKLGRPVLGHLNHPHFGWAFSVQDLAHIEAERFFEVYNGHNQNQGDATHIPIEDMWDQALVIRLEQLHLPLLNCIASDDAHNYQKYATGQANPGRGWVMVRCPRLDGDSIIKAMQAGQYYSSSGVVLKDFRITARDYSLTIQPHGADTFVTRFIGVRQGKLEVFHQVSGLAASYHLKGDELYVRATVTSSRRHPNPAEAGEHERAWLQPTRP